MVIATQDQLERVKALGIAVLGLMEPHVEEMLKAGANEESRSQAVGQALLPALLLAGNEVEWFNRVYLIQGLGIALGELLAQWPAAASALIERFDRGVAAGHARCVEALKPQGRA